MRKSLTFILSKSKRWIHFCEELQFAGESMFAGGGRVKFKEGVMHDLWFPVLGGEMACLPAPRASALLLFKYVEDILKQNGVAHNVVSMGRTSITDTWEVTYNCSQRSAACSVAMTEHAEGRL